MKERKRMFLFLGALFALMSGFLLFVAFMADARPTGMFYIIFAIAVMCFCLSYLYPQFIQKDERMKLIRQKGMLASFFAMLIYIVIFMTALHFDFIAVSADYLLSVFAGLMICTVYVSFVVYAKIY